MRTIKVPVVTGRDENGDPIEGISHETVYKIDELPLLEVLNFSGCSTKNINKNGQNRKIHYVEVPAAFDIETTNIYEKVQITDRKGITRTKTVPDPRPYAFMYHWQFCLDKYVVFGRTWEEFQELIRYLSEGISFYKGRDYKIVVWVHNLAFEFQFMRQFLRVTGGFYREPYKPFKIETADNIEFRDSLVLSNMNLQKFCSSSAGCIHWKLKDTYDYSKIRTKSTPLTEEEEAYCYNDVRGLCECIAARMKDDTLSSMPMTSTGYVRRDTRNAMRKNKKNRRLFRRNSIVLKTLYSMQSSFSGRQHSRERQKNWLNSRWASILV